MISAKTVALPFIAGLSVYSMLGAALFLSFGKEGTHLMLNAHHHPVTDTFFIYITYLGDGRLPIFFILILLLIRYSWALALGASSILMGITVQFLKRSVFSADHRPAMFFESGGLPTIEGVQLMLHHSFPSGHSATAFCLWMMMAFIMKQKWATYLFFSIAILASFSRVYISQHFIQDTIVGAWIGLILTLLAYLFIIRPAELNPASKLNKRILP